jgi:hypothetical protein
MQRLLQLELLLLSGIEPRKSKKLTMSESGWF